MDDISVWASGMKIPELEVKINDYLKEMSEFLKSNSLLISAPKSTVTLFTPETKQAKYHPDIKIAVSQLPLPQPEDLRGPPGHIPNFQRTLHTSGNKSQQQKQRLEGLSRHYLGTTEGDDTDDLQGNRKSVANYSAPVWSTNASGATSIGKIQTAQNEALGIATGSHKMSSIDHLHSC